MQDAPDYPWLDELKETSFPALFQAVLPDLRYQSGHYFLYEIFAKVKTAVVCTLFIHELSVGTYLKNNRQFKLEDQIQIKGGTK